MNRSDIVAAFSAADDHGKRAEFDKAESLLSSILSEPSATDSDRAAAHLVIGLQNTTRGRYAIALEHIERALEIGRGHSDAAVEANALRVLADLEYARGDYAASLTSANEAAAVARSCGDSKSLGHASNAVGNALNALGNAEGALEHHLRAAELLAECGDPAGEGECIGNIGRDYSLMGRDDLAVEYISRSLEFARRTGSPRNAAFELLSLGNIEKDRGNRVEAMSRFTQALAEATTAGDSRLRGLALFGIGYSCEAIGDYSGSIDAYSEALELLESAENYDRRVATLCNLAILLSTLGEYDRAATLYQKCLELAREKGDVLAEGMALGNVGAAMLAQGDLENALRTLQEALDLCRQIGAWRPASCWLLSLAELYHAQGELDTALAHVVEAMRLQREVLCSDEHLASSCIELGRILVDRGDRAEGCARIVEGLAIAEGLGQRADAEDAHKALADFYAEDGDMANAYEHFRRHYELRQEIFDAETYRRLEAFKVREALAKQENEAEQHRLRAEYLKRELAMRVAAMTAQTEMLDNFRRQLLAIFQDMGEPIAVLRSIRDKLRDLPHQEMDWTRFDAEFTLAHPEFRSTLRDKYPELTSSEIRLCVMLRLGIRSHEAASILGLSERTVEKHRANIRRKMRIRNGEDLVNVLAAI